MKKHILKQGEKLSELSAIYSIPVCMIVRANSFSSPEEIFPGIAVLVPERDYCRVADSMIIHTVLHGETMFDISNKYGVTMREILRENDIGVHEIFAGIKLKIPSSPKNMNMYNSKMGESYASIAKKFNLQESDLRLINGENMYPGMQIYIKSSH